MNHPGDISRRGMSLIELLVVVAILGLLTVVVLPNIANTGDRRKVREAARQVSSFIAGAQARAIGSRAGAGIWINLEKNLISGDDGLQHVVALDLAMADVPEPYAGETVGSVVTPNPNAKNTDRFLQLTFTEAIPGTLGPLPKLISFDGSPTRFKLHWMMGASATAERIHQRNQTAENAPWPVMPQVGNGLPYQIFLPATRSATETLTLGDGVVIDLSWAALGPTGAAATWPPSANILPNAPVQLLYDAAGSPSAIIANNGEGQPVIDPVYLLVTTIEAIQEGTCFTGADSYWVAIDPRGGIPRVAEVCPPSPRPSGPWAPRDNDQLVFTQQFIRQQPVQTGR